MAFPGFVHATVPTPATLMPVPAFAGPNAIALPFGHVEEEVNELAEPPWQIVTPVAVGVGFIVIETVVVLLHPLELVPVTV